MIKETLDKNVEVKPNSKEIEMLKREFPQCFDKSGVFDIKIFEELIKTEDVEIKKEGYSLEFLGKSYARYLASLDSETIIVPDASNKNNDSENVYIIGDNLDALQHLKYSYANSIKCIYIDPPYNTGSDGFVYNDKFEFAAEELAKKIGIEEDEAERVLNMEGKSTHSAWLTFMYPRLELARDLLKEDGVIFISVDDNEHANIKRLCDEIFGESNFITSIVWRKKAGGANDSTDIAVEHEYIVCYKKKLNGIYKVPLSAERIKEYKYSDEKEETHGKYTLKNLNDKSLQDSKGLHFDIVCPDETILYGKDNQWKCNEETFKQRLKDNRIVFNKKTDGEWICNYNMTIMVI